MQFQKDFDLIVEWLRGRQRWTHKLLKQEVWLRPFWNCCLTDSSVLLSGVIRVVGFLVCLKTHLHNNFSFKWWVLQKDVKQIRRTEILNQVFASSNLDELEISSSLKTICKMTQCKMTQIISYLDISKNI